MGGYSAGFGKRRKKIHISKKFRKCWKKMLGKEAEKKTLKKQWYDVAPWHANTTDQKYGWSFPLSHASAG